MPAKGYRKPRDPCAIDGCPNSAKARGWCGTHYARWRKRGDPGDAALLRLKGRECSILGCTRPVSARGWCGVHYGRWRMTGNPLSPAKRAANGTGYTQDGYRAIGNRYEHRAVMEASLGRKLRPGESVHHRNGVRGDNHLSNLELWFGKQPAGQRVEDLLAFYVPASWEAEVGLVMC